MHRQQRPCTGRGAPALARFQPVDSHGRHKGCRQLHERGGGQGQVRARNAEGVCKQAGQAGSQAGRAARREAVVK